MLSTDLCYLARIPLYEREKPYYAFVELPPGTSPTNCELKSQQDITINDVRGKEQNYSIDRNGFSFTKSPSAAIQEMVSRGGVEATLVNTYLKETMELLKKEMNTEHVVCFDWRIRKEGASQASIDPATFAGNRSQAIPVAACAHCDYSFDGGLARVKRQLTVEEAEDYMTDKWDMRIINVWRPLVQMVERAPLALCDPSSVDLDDLIPVDKVHHDHWEEGYLLHHSEGQKWFWWSDQTMDEASIFVTWDGKSRESVPPPHTAFENSAASTNAPPRTSIEVRSIVFNRRGRDFSQ